MSSENLGIRISKKNAIIPNIELKTIKNEVEKYVLDNRLKVKLDKNLLYLSPLEIQLAYKLFLGGEKDIMDAVYLYELFQNNIQRDEIEYWAKYFKIQDKLDNFWWRDEGIWKEKIWWKQRTNSKGAWGRKGKKLQAKDRVCKIICRMDKENTK